MTFGPLLFISFGRVVGARGGRAADETAAADVELTDDNDPVVLIRSAWMAVCFTASASDSRTGTLVAVERGALEVGMALRGIAEGGDLVILGMADGLASGLVLTGGGLLSESEVGGSNLEGAAAILVGACGI